MLPSRPRSGSWGGGSRTTPPPASNATPRHESSRSTTTYSPLPCERGGRGDMTEQMVAQLEGELRAEKEERARALQELVELRSKVDGTAKDHAAAAPGRERLLERGAAAAKETETKMLESLIRQTKELEQAKVALEEAKLETATLRQGGAATAEWSVMDLMFGGVDDEINGLRGKLRAAVMAEERSRKAADELTAALSAVTMEAKQVKAWLSDSQAELESTHAEVERLEGSLHAAEAELWSVTEQLNGLTPQWKEAAAAWRAREKALLGRARAAEDEADGARQENAELAKLHRVVDDENGGLRRALEQAVEEVNAANESLEFAGSENSKLRDAIANKEDALERLRQENETLKASEAAAQVRAKDLDGRLAAATKKAADGAGEKAAALPLEKWRSGEMQGKLSAAFLDSGGVMANRKDRMFASLSNIAELRSAAAAAAMDDYDYEFDHLDGGRQYGELEHTMKHRKRRSILRKFGDFFRRRSLYKSNLAPVPHY